MFCTGGYRKYTHTERAYENTLIWGWVKKYRYGKRGIRFATFTHYYKTESPLGKLGESKALKKSFVPVILSPTLTGFQPPL